MKNILPILTLVPIVVLAISVVHASRTKKNDNIRKISSVFYTLEIAFSYLWIAGFSLAKQLPYSTVLIFLTLPIAIACCKTMRNSREDAEHLRADITSRTANLLLQFVIMLTVGLILGRFLPEPGVFFN
jgi:Mn2+/Fe2+ NRAMP family transporter